MDNLTRSLIKSFIDLRAWQQSHQLSLRIYKITKAFPSEEKFALINQLRRASVSVSSNIAEGFSRNTSRDKAQFYTMAIGSLYEIHSQLLLAKDLGYISTESYNAVFTQVESATKLTNRLKSSAYKLGELATVK